VFFLARIAAIRNDDDEARRVSLGPVSTFGGISWPPQGWGPMVCHSHGYHTPAMLDVFFLGSFFLGRDYGPFEVPSFLGNWCI